MATLPTFHISLAYNPSMKTEELLRRQADEEKKTAAAFWPWLVPGHNPGVEIATLFEELIRETVQLSNTEESV